ncbi:MAG TPA: hypothetical protein VFZ70_16390 [Euzebyales bacterium]
MVTLVKRIGAGVGWLALILGVAGAAWAVGVERWADRWGATDAEVAVTLPGDELIEDPAMVTTRAVTVRTPPDGVWPWIAQFGQGRGGLYSYDWLERVFGMDIKSVDRVLPDEQDVVVGDQIWITQPGYPADLGLVVADVEPGRALVLAASTPSRPTAPEDAPWTWTFAVRSDGAGHSRLVVRNRNATVGPIGDAVWDRVVGPIGFAMERRTMLGIADRAEATAGTGGGRAWREPVWFAALVATGAGLLAIAATGAPRSRRLAYVTVLTVAATLVLLRFPSPLASVALAAVSWSLVVLLWRAWRVPAEPRGRMPRAQSRKQQRAPADHQRHASDHRRGRRHAGHRSATGPTTPSASSTRTAAGEGSTR